MIHSGDMQAKSSAWNWNTMQDEYWLYPSYDVVGIGYRWKRLKNFTHVLDLGCGRGRHSLFFAESGFTVDAFDLSAEGIHLLEQESQKKKLPIHTRIGNMTQLPYEDMSFDCILAYHVVYHIDEQGMRKTLSELDRVLKKNGELYLSFNSKLNPSFNDPAHTKIDGNMIIKNTGSESGIIHYYVDESDLKQLMKNFKLIEIFRKEHIYSERRGVHYFVLASK